MPRVRTKKDDYAKRMRQNPTPSEAALWEEIRARRFGFRFIRQKVIFGWIVDFWCAAQRLAVEVDGPYHQFQPLADRGRDAALLRHGIRTLRLTNEEVESDMPRALERIGAALSAPVRPRARVRRSADNRDRLPIGLIIHRLIHRGYSYKDAVVAARDMAARGR